ncbi:MAG: hypothetical protein AB1414_20570 [bacterium]
MIKKMIGGVICFLILTPQVYSEEVYKIGIEERLIRLEEGQKALNQRLDDMNQRFDDMNQKFNQRLDDMNQKFNQRFDDMNQRLNDMMGIMLSGFGVLLAGMFSLTGFVIWDRRTAIVPVAKKTRKLEEEEELIVKALLEYANVEPKMQKVLTRLGLYKKELLIST